MIIDLRSKTVIHDIEGLNLSPAATEALHRLSSREIGRTAPHGDIAITLKEFQSIANCTFVSGTGERLKPHYESVGRNMGTVRLASEKTVEPIYAAQKPPLRAAR